MKIERNGKIYTEFLRTIKRKDATLYYTDEKNGFFIRKDGLKGQFGTLENGRLFYQHTLATFTE